MALRQSYQLMSPEQVSECLESMARTVLDHNHGRPVVLVGIQRRGVPMANRMAEAMHRMSGTKPHVGMLDINMYRDDLSLVAEQPVLRKTEVPSIQGLDVVLTDDVLYTGRTIRSALNALMDLGQRPRTIQLAVMVDRGHRELPIEANVVGKRLATKDNEVVEVKLTEIDGQDAIFVMEKE